MADYFPFISLQADGWDVVSMSETKLSGCIWETLLSAPGLLGNVLKLGQGAVLQVIILAYFVVPLHTWKRVEAGTGRSAAGQLTNALCDASTTTLLHHLRRSDRVGHGLHTGSWNKALHAGGRCAVSCRQVGTLDFQTVS